MKQNINKKGFTLIELLAVIVILAIIALIATPIILNMINDAKKSAAKDSSYGYTEAIEYNNSMANLELNNGYTKIEGTDLDVTTLDVKVKGTKPTSGKVTIEKGIVTKATLCINGYEVEYQNNNASVIKKCNETLSEAAYVNLSGMLTDSSNNPLSNKVIVVFSDTPHYSLTTSSGYFYIENIENGEHEFYYLNESLSEVQNMSKEEIKNNAISSSIFNTKDKLLSIKNVNDLNIGTEIEFKKGELWNFDYTGNEEIFLAPAEGKYKLETWGAQGGSYNTTYIGGYGGYSVGNIKFNKNNIIYINVGGSGKFASANGITSGGYNGGGCGNSSSDNRQGSGGGATHIAKVSGELYQLSNYAGEYNEDAKTYLSNDILIVSAGGGGAVHWYNRTNNYSYSKGGNAGGYTGGNSSTLSYKLNSSSFGKESIGATQTNGGKRGVIKASWGGTGIEDGLFGKGADAPDVGYSGGGGGFYGGGLGAEVGGSGGSSYIGNPLLKEKSMYCFDCLESEYESIMTVSTSGSSTKRDAENCPKGYAENPVSKCAKQGNGYAKITYLGK